MRIKPRLIIEKFKEYNNSFSDAAEKLGIHKTTVWRWVKKAKLSSRSRIGDISSRNLKRKSTRPHTIHYALTRKDESAIIKL